MREIQPQVLNEIIDQTKYENMAIITLLCPEMVSFKPQIGFQLFVSLLYLCSLFIFHYSRFWLSIEGRSEEWDEVVIALTAYQKQVSRSPLPNTPFERVDNIPFTIYRPLNWFNIA
jgi:hypothetical protein